IDKMDEQGVDRAFLFPTLGITVEGYMLDDPTLLHSVLHSFNLWIDDDWGIDRDGRMYCPPVVSMATVDGAVAELEWALSRGAKAISVQPGPLNGRSPADPYFDPFWARVNESGVVIGYHGPGGPMRYDREFQALWGRESSDRDGYLRMLQDTINTLER